MGKAGMYCLMALLALMTILAGVINPEGTGHINRAGAIQSGSPVHSGFQPLVASGGDSRSGPITVPSPPPIPPHVGLEAYSLQPEHAFGFYGGGFAPNEYVEALLETSDAAPSPRSGLLLAKPYTNPGGNLAGRAFIPLLPAGSYSLLFVGLQSRKSIIVGFNIRGFSPWVTLSDYAPLPHSKIGFNGQDFAPWEPVLVYLNQKKSNPIAHLHADSTGGFNSQQAWEVPELSGDNTLIFTGSYSGTVATVAFKPMPSPTPVAPTPAPAIFSKGTELAQGSRAQSLPADRHSTPLLATSSVMGNQQISIDSLLQDPVTIVLLFLGLWSILCVLLTLPLMLPRRHKQQSKKQSSSQCSSLSESTAKNHNEKVHVLPVSVLPAPRLLSQNSDGGTEEAAHFCPWCGLRNTARSSRCVSCKRDLPYLPAGGDKVGQPSKTLHPIGPQLLQTPSPGLALAPTSSELALSKTQVSQVNDLVMEHRRSPLALGMRVSAKSDRGRKRAERENEDDFLVVTGTRRARGEMQPFGLFVVADGMGGHNDGQIASRLIIETVFKDLIPVLMREDASGEDLLALLQGAIQNANWRLYSQNEQEHSSLGATVTAALVAGREAAICNVGDSRVYLLSPQSPLHRVTVDHSIVESLVVAGIIQREDVYTHPKRNLIFRSMGQRQRVQIDTFRQPMLKGDQLLLCSDGLWEMIRDREIEQTLRQCREINRASEKLIELANEHGGLDNITAILVEMMDESEVASHPVIQHIDSNSVSVDQTRRGLSLLL